MLSDKSRSVNQQLKSFDAQQGWTMWSMMFVMSVLFTAAYLGMRLVPIYTTSSSIKNAMYISVEDKDLQKISRASVIKSIKAQLYLDANHGLLDYKNDMKMARTKNQFILEASYEQEVPLVANLVLVARFNPKVECELNGRCDRK